MRPGTERSTRLLILGLLWPVPLVAQHEVELHLGHWMGDNDARTYELRTGGHLGGPFSHGAKALITVSEPLGRRRAFYGLGYDLMMFRPEKGLAPTASSGSPLWAGSI